MISARNEHIVILGGGIAGLTTGLELLRRGRQVTVIEKGERVGGLARTIIHDGFRFDIGGHRFHSQKPKIVSWLRDLLGSDLLYVPRISRIYLQGKFVDYPLRFPNALSIFTPAQVLAVLSSYGAATLKSRLNGKEPDRSFEDWVVKRFGRTMFEVFFGPYTEKVWGISCQDLSADWAAQRISLPSLTATVRRAIVPGSSPPATIISQFWYPRLGFGMIPDRLASEITKVGGRVIRSAAVTGLKTQDSGWQVTIQAADGHHHLAADRLVSSIPLNLLLKALPAESGAHAVERNFRLTYRDMILLFLAFRVTQISPDSWTYFPQKSLLCGRTHEPRNWSQAMAPAAYTSLAAEVFTSRGEETWDLDDDALIHRAVSEFEDIGFLPQNCLQRGWVLRVPYAYPVYTIGYAEKVKQVLSYLTSNYPTLHLVGRTGSFRYMNSDAVIEDALSLTAYLTGEQPEHTDVTSDYRVS